MATAALPIRRIETEASRALAYALLASHTDVLIAVLYRLWETSRVLSQLLELLNPQVVEMLAADRSEIAAKVKETMEKTHQLIVRVSYSDHAESLLRFPVIGSLLSTIQNQSQDLGDIVDTLALASNPDFQSLVSRCTANLEINDTEGHSIGRLYN